jgi:hypothetical protein
MHPGIMEALQQAIASFRNGLYVPALAMLDAASEGSWFEAGQALAARPPVDSGGAKLASVLQDPSKSMRSKAAAVCDYFETRKDAQKVTGVAPVALRESLQWSGIVRDGRNVLHWNVVANIPNDYAKVATLLMAGVTHLKRLHLVATA